MVVLIFFSLSLGRGCREAAGEGRAFAPTVVPPSLKLSR